MSDANSANSVPAYERTVYAGVKVEEIERPMRPHLLEQVRGPGSPRQVQLQTDRFTIGRAPECDLSVESGGISWNHLLITRRGPEYACEDCGSTNGVYLNGVRIQSAVLREADRIQISEVVFIYHEGA